MYSLAPKSSVIRAAVIGIAVGLSLAIYRSSSNPVPRAAPEALLPQLAEIYDELIAKMNVIYEAPALPDGWAATTNPKAAWEPRYVNTTTNGRTFVSPSFVYTKTVGIKQRGTNGYDYSYFTQVNTRTNQVPFYRDRIATLFTNDTQYSGTFRVYGRECFEDTPVIVPNFGTFIVKATVDESVVRALEDGLDTWESIGGNDRYSVLASPDYLNQERIDIANNDTNWFSPLSYGYDIRELIRAGMGGLDAGQTSLAPYVFFETNINWRNAYMYATPYLYGANRSWLAWSVVAPSSASNMTEDVYGGVTNRIWPTGPRNVIPTCWFFTTNTTATLEYQYVDRATNETDDVVSSIYLPGINTNTFMVYTAATERVTNTYTRPASVNAIVRGPSFIPQKPKLYKTENVTNEYGSEIEDIAWIYTPASEYEEYAADADFGYVVRSKLYDPEQLTLSVNIQHPLSYLYNVGSLRNFVAPPQGYPSMTVVVTNEPLFSTNTYLRSVTGVMSTNIFTDGGSVYTNVATSHTFTNNVVYQSGGPKQGDAVTMRVSSSEPLYYGNGVRTCQHGYGYGELDATATTYPAISQTWVDTLRDRLDRILFEISDESSAVLDENVFQISYSYSGSSTSEWTDWTITDGSASDPVLRDAWAEAITIATNTATAVTNMSSTPHINSSYYWVNVYKTEGGVEITGVTYYASVGGETGREFAYYDKRQNATNLFVRALQRHATYSEAVPFYETGWATNAAFDGNLWHHGGCSIGIETEDISSDAVRRRFYFGTALEFPKAWGSSPCLTNAYPPSVLDSFGALKADELY